MRETARDHTPMTALPYYHVAARAVPAITATPCGGYPPEKRLTDTLTDPSLGGVYRKIDPL